MLAIQAVEILSDLHERKVVHKNISPHSLCMGQGVKSGKLHLLNLGKGGYIGK